MTIDAPEQAVAFGTKCAWLAIRTTDANALHRLLALEGAHVSSWREGVEAGYSRMAPSVFVTPPIDGWVLVLGYPLLELTGSAVVALSLRTKLAVQYFLSVDGAHAYGWMHADAGTLVRAFAVVDDSVLETHGPPTQHEQDLEINFDIHQEPPAFSKADPQPYRQWLRKQVSEDMVLRIAERWSVDPSKLDQRKLGKGWIARWTLTL
jgi:hypothetical protein